MEEIINYVLSIHFLASAPNGQNISIRVQHKFEKENGKPWLQLKKMLMIPIWPLRLSMPLKNNMIKLSLQNRSSLKCLHFSPFFLKVYMETLILYLTWNLQSFKPCPILVFVAEHVLNFLPRLLHLPHQLACPHSPLYHQLPHPAQPMQNSCLFRTGLLPAPATAKKSSKQSVTSPSHPWVCSSILT